MRACAARGSPSAVFNDDTFHAQLPKAIRTDKRNANASLWSFWELLLIRPEGARIL